MVAIEAVEDLEHAVDRREIAGIGLFGQLVDDRVEAPDLDFGVVPAPAGPRSPSIRRAGISRRARAYNSGAGDLVDAFAGGELIEHRARRGATALRNGHGHSLRFGRGRGDAAVSNPLSPMCQIMPVMA